ncbi:TetR family transcriptional regulator [Microlunatus speluncae]|uniref:TetR family transcriptional regulator n=1 Tax=Microlunatus speluncae TaxID=2594267 RepID=UPI00126657EB|nr:TetR family transcriptional regulator [Microlunatus speluncae]
MALNRDQILDCGFRLLREHGLATLSMRRLATDLGVAPGALYWHVPSKQELLADLAERIIAPLSPAPADPIEAAIDLRAALLAVRDGAEVVSFALALRPDGLRPLRKLYESFGSGLSSDQARWAGRTLVLYVLGSVAEEQNRSELERAGHLPRGAEREEQVPDDFRFGIEVIVGGTARRAHA